MYCLTFELIYKPLGEPLDRISSLQNEVCYMLLNYLMLGMTDFTSASDKDFYGLGVIALTIITTLTNFYVYF